jgi:hypothetical protein
MGFGVRSSRPGSIGRSSLLAIPNHQRSSSSELATAMAPAFGSEKKTKTKLLFS